MFVPKPVVVVIDFVFVFEVADIFTTTQTEVCVPAVEVSVHPL